jgi:hypothetical protein
MFSASTPMANSFNQNQWNRGYDLLSSSRESVAEQIFLAKMRLGDDTGGFFGQIFATSFI